MSRGAARDVETRLGDETQRLVSEFRGTFDEATVRRCVHDARKRIAGARVDDYVPVLVGRYARELLRAAASTDRKGVRERPEVLFVCVQNAGRSQMAAALLRHLAGDRVVVRSAGSTPASEIHAPVVEVLREIGLDPAEEFPKPLADEFVRAADVVVTMGCGDACPVLPGKRYEDWKVTDPAGRPLEEVRAVREEIRARVETLLASLGIAAAKTR